MLPSVIDIEMAIDRFLATRFIEENIFFLRKEFVPCKPVVIPFLYSPAYTIGNIVKLSMLLSSLLIFSSMKEKKSQHTHLVKIHFQILDILLLISKLVIR